MTPTTDIEVTGSRGRTPITAIIDTGFDGQLCLPKMIAVHLGLELVSLAGIELADGTQKTELVFGGGRVRFLGRSRSVRIFLTDSEDSLIGTGLLAGCRLLIDFQTGKVRLTRKPPRRGKRST